MIPRHPGGLPLLPTTYHHHNHLGKKGRRSRRASLCRSVCFLLVIGAIIGGSVVTFAPHLLPSTKAKAQGAAAGTGRVLSEHAGDHHAHVDATETHEDAFQPHDPAHEPGWHDQVHHDQHHQPEQHHYDTHAQHHYDEEHHYDPHAVQQHHYEDQHADHHYQHHYDDHHAYDQHHHDHTHYQDGHAQHTQQHHEGGGHHDALPHAPVHEASGAIVHPEQHHGGATQHAHIEAQHVPAHYKEPGAHYHQQQAHNEPASDPRGAVHTAGGHAPGTGVDVGREDERPRHDPVHAPGEHQAVPHESAHHPTTTQQPARVQQQRVEPTHNEPQRQPVHAPQTQSHGPHTDHSREVIVTSDYPVRGLYKLAATTIDGEEISLARYAGKVTLVVNVASACGYTDVNYRGLQKTYEKYKDFGLEILGFPCNQFGHQEAGSDAQIKDFCSGHYHVTFPMFSKIEVNGPNAHPIFQFLKTNLPESEGGGGGHGPGQDIAWNFFKYVVDPDGHPVKRFDMQYDSAAVEGEIYRLLSARKAAGAATSTSH
mmetsp:Transcript_9758/g.24296  ORF Transcript_9758/g.24296 Transcript_9758/m.24296 type:complete len:538 (-) Transcript_9758:512-2125(-)